MCNDTPCMTPSSDCRLGLPPERPRVSEAIPPVCPPSLPCPRPGLCQLFSAKCGIECLSPCPFSSGLSEVWTCQSHSRLEMLPPQL